MCATGLTLGGYLDNHPVDLLEEVRTVRFTLYYLLVMNSALKPFCLHRHQRYKKLKENSSAFTITQFGLSAFTWDATENKYVPCPAPLCVCRGACACTCGR
jgi:hypothetical protein